MTPSTTDGASFRLMTSDEYPASAAAIEAAFGVPPVGPTTGPGRRLILTDRRLPVGLTYATVHKERERKTYRFSKDWRVHEAMSYFTLYRYNFCWVVRTLRQQDDQGRWQRRTPAMAAGLADHVWSTRAWVSFPAVQVA